MRRALVLAATIGVGLGVIACTTGLPLTELPQNSMVPNFGPVAQVDRMAENLYFVPGGGGNTAIFVHDTGVLVVDTKVARNGQTIIDVVRSITDKPITEIVNTHHHPDHAGSNAEFPAAVEIIAHENARTNMANTPAFQTEEGRVGLPDRTFRDRMTLFSGRDAVDLYYFGRAHTNGDTFVVFRNARVMHAGDAFPMLGGILIDRSAGGSALALPDTLTGAIDNVHNVDRVITGHASVAPWQTLVDFRDFHRLMLAHAQAEHAAGHTAEQALASFHPPEKYNSWRWGQPNSAPSAAAPIGPTAGGRAPPAGGYFATIYGELQ